MNVKFLISVGATCVLTSALGAANINTSALSQNGWYSDDTRADGLVGPGAGTNLVSNTLTDNPEATATGSAAHDAAILAQIMMGYAPGAFPSMTHPGAVRLRIGAGTGAGGKSTISHRKDDGIGHAAAGSTFGPGFSATYSWLGASSSATLTAALKIGIKTSEFGLAPVSTRTGEGAWDKLLVYEPYINSSFADGVWHVETTTYSTGKWWIVDRIPGGGNSQGDPMALADMPLALGMSKFVGSRTVAAVFAVITAPGSHITSIQFGVGSNNPGADVYVNQIATSFYRAGDTTTFGPSPFDQNVTPDAIFGAGNVNGSFTVDRRNGVELGLRGKLRYPSSNIFNSNGDGTYTFNTGTGGGPMNNAEWSFEWSANTNWDGSAAMTHPFLDDLTYEIGMDWNPGPGTSYLKFDHITPNAPIPYVPPTMMPFWDHSIGTNATMNGAGTEAVDAPGYLALLGANNVAQNSWRPVFFTSPTIPTSPFVFNPSVNGRYEFYLSAYSGAARLARTAITIFALDKTTLTLEGDECQTTDQDPFTPGTQIKVELHLRNPDSVSITGFQAFLEFNSMAMTYVGATSTYTTSPFIAHIQNITTAQVSAGKLRLDGSTAGLVPPTTDDALLATLYFTVSECAGNSVSFDLGQPFPSETSFGGSAIMTDLLNSPTIVADTVPPVIGPHANITQSADAGTCTGAVVTYTPPTVTDACDMTPTLVCSPPSGSTFPIGPTTVTCVATDDCGNQSMSTFTVTITATNDVDVIVHLQGSGPTSRCIHFRTNPCSMPSTDTVLTFSGMAPAVVSTTIQVPCGVWTSLCAKDKQHTKWDTTTITDVGAKYTADVTLVLKAGDTDNDGDVDINDVTLLVAQYGTSPGTGGCPWNPLIRSADFNNDTIVGAADYSILSGGGSWLTTSSCACPLPLEEKDEELAVETSVFVHDELTDAADLNRDGRVDVRDVELLEQRHRLSGELSKRLREAEER